MDVTKMPSTHIVKLFVIFFAVNFTMAQEKYMTNTVLTALLKDKDINITAQVPDMAVLSTGDDTKMLLENLYKFEYWLYTKQNPTTAQILDSYNRTTILSSNFDATLQTVVTVHGWEGSGEDELNTAIRDAYFEIMDVNVIVLDWSRLAGADYVTASIGVPETGRELGRFLNYLVGVTGAPFDNMHLIGFSLGAHIVGIAGRELRGQIARITGLDPAGPLWDVASQRLQSSDAFYVETIHTNKGLLGTLLNIGDIDFYPNGGAAQPGCTDAVCSHNRAWQLFVASLTNDIIGQRCESYMALLLASCHDELLPLGTSNLDKAGLNGIYYLRTNSEYPYYLQTQN